MPRQRDRNIALVNRYIASGGTWPVEPRRIAEWALNQRLWTPPVETLVKQATEEITDAMRNEYLTDPQGRRVRAKIAARVKREGKQITLWGDQDSDPQFVRLAFAQRRRLVVGESYQLKLDVDSYNENRNPDRPIEISFNFEPDLREKEAIREMDQLKELGSLSPTASPN